MKLKDLLTKLEYKVVKGSDTIEVSHLQNDSRKVSDGDAFVCIKGAGFDGHEFIRDVVSKGAVAVVVMDYVEVDEDVTVVKVDDTRLALACMSADYFGNPAEKLITIGITGTKGKTTTTYMVRSVLESVGIKTGLIGTIETIIGDEVTPAKNTTPESYVNGDYNFKAQNIKLFTKPGCLCVSYDLKGKMDFPVEIHVPGMFSVYNSLCAIAICSHFTEDVEKIQTALENVKVKGRVEIIPVSKRFTLMIDYAHNAMSLESLLTSLKQYNPKRLVTVFGCGGNRSKERRFEMGEVSSRLSDFTIVTSDNPRFEEPMDIINDILVGVKKADGEYVTVPDRKDAIRYAILNAKDGDVIILAGKGHEDYQEIKGVKHPMDERVLIKEIIEEDQVKAIL